MPSRGISAIGRFSFCNQPTVSGVLLKRFQELPGFDNHAFIVAMGSGDDARFLCWKWA